MTQQQIISAPQARTGPMPTGGRWGWYQDHEGNSFRRASKLIKKVETDTYNLDLWFRRQVAEGLAIRDDLVLALKAMGRPGPEGWSRDEKKTINEIAKSAAEAAKQRDGAKVGTAFHTLTERVDRGEPIDAVAAGLPAAAAQTIRAYALMRQLNGWQTVEVERTVVCDELEVAGTFDRVELIPGLAAMLGPGACQHGHGPGDEHYGGHDDRPFAELPVIADVKTEESPWLNGLHIGPQLGIYSRARRMWRPTGGFRILEDAKGEAILDRDGREQQVANGEYVAAPCVRQDVAVVVHLRDGRSTPYFINLIEGWEAAQAAYAQMNRETRAKRRLGSAGCWFVLVPGIIEPPLLTTLIETAVAADYGNPARLGPVPASAPVEQVAVRGPDGLVRWQDKTSAEMIGLPGAAEAEASMCDNCAPLLLKASVTRVDGTEFGTLCVHCGGVDERSAAGGGEQYELRRMLIEAIWRAVTTDGLAILWNMARDRGVPWAGPVEQAATARAVQINCPQRELHTGGGKCACGWIAGVPA